MSLQVPASRQDVSLHGLTGGELGRGRDRIADGIADEGELAAEYSVSGNGRRNHVLGVRVCDQTLLVTKLVDHLERLELTEVADGR